MLAKKISLEILPMQKILEFFQTKKTVKIDGLTDYELQQVIMKRRKLIGIKTDLNSIINLSMTNRYFNDLIKRSDIGKLILTIYYNAEITDFSSVPQHIAYCPEPDCKNVCHYVNKDIKHNNLIKKIAISKFEQLKKNKNFKKDIIPFFETHLNSKQIVSYYKIKKMDKKLKEYGEKTKPG